MSSPLHRFAEALRQLLACSTPGAIERVWSRESLDDLGWAAIRVASCGTDPALVPVLDETDGLLLRALDRVPLIARRAPETARRLTMFRLPALERLQHATAAALVAHRFGPAGLATMVADQGAPLGRRYHALLTLARLHVETTWSLFDRYLRPEAHHAFVGVAAEAARYYPERGAAGELVALFDGVRRDLPLRAFLSPRILRSLFVLGDPLTLPLYRDLLVTGHTDPDPGHCEVTHALVMVRRLTGTVEESSKFPDPDAAAEWLDEAETTFERERDLLHPVVML
jgi:hypothetical protein